MNELCLLALGGNLPSSVGTPEFTISEALKRLNVADLRLCSVSRFYQTPCFPAGAGPDYINAAVTLRSHLSATDLLSHLHSIEAAFGREREQRWGMRTLDIDLIAMGAQVLPDVATQQGWRDLALSEQVRATPEQLILPHPRLQDRAFVLGPLMDVAAHWQHPLLGLTVAEMYENLPETDQKALWPL